MTLRRNSSSGQENKPFLGVCGGGREGGREEGRDGERRAAPGCPPRRGGRERQPGRARKRHREAPGRSELRRWEAGSRAAEEPGSAPPGGRRRSGAAPSPRQPYPGPPVLAQASPAPSPPRSRSRSTNYVLGGGNRLLHRGTRARPAAHGEEIRRCHPVLLRVSVSLAIQAPDEPSSKFAWGIAADANGDRLLSRVQFGLLAAFETEIWLPL